MPSSISNDHASAPPDPHSSMTSSHLDTTRNPLQESRHLYSSSDGRRFAKVENSSQRLDKRSPEYMIKSGIAGGFAGCVGKTVVAPLDRVKILFQASNPQFAKYTGSWLGFVTAAKDIRRQEGARGLFRGHSATLLRIFPYAGIKFLAYEQIRARIIKDKSQETHLRRFMSGSLAGVVSVFTTYPLEVIRVRLAFETKRDSRSTFTSICRKIYNEHPPIAQAARHIDTSSVSRTAVSAASVTGDVVAQSTPRSGLANFFRGFTPTLWGMLPYAGVSFLVHDTVSDMMRVPTLAPYTILEHTRGSRSNPDKPPQLRSWAELIAGGSSGLIAQTVSYPLEIIRRRMQVGGVVGDGHRLRMAEVAARIWVERGWRGFFVGLGIGYVKIIPMAATSFYAYERGKFYLGI